MQARPKHYFLTAVGRCVDLPRVNSKIVAFYEGDIERRPLAKALGQYVPAFMVPNVFRQVESMPLTKNGKIDRNKLLKLYEESLHARHFKK